MNEETRIRYAFERVHVSAENVMEGVRNKMKEERRMEKEKARGLRFRLVVPMAAALIMVFSVTAVLAFGGYDWLTNRQARFDEFVERHNPAFAAVIEPVMGYAEDNGIRVTVYGAQIYSRQAIVYFSVQDVSGTGQLTEASPVFSTMRLFNNPTIPSEMLWFSANLGYWNEINFLEYDEENNKFYFEARQSLGTDEMVLEFTEIALRATIIENRPVGVNLADAAVVDGIYMSGRENSVALSGSGSQMSSSPMVEITRKTLEVGRYAEFPHEGGEQWISNIGIIDGRLHVQTEARYTQTISSRLVGTVRSLALIDDDGKMIIPSLLFRAHITNIDNSSSNIIEYIFDVDIDDLSRYTLVYDGQIIEGITGNWRVDIDLDEVGESIVVAIDIRLRNHHYTRVFISPLGLRVEGTWTEGTHDTNALRISRLEMLDGTFVSVERGVPGSLVPINGLVSSSLSFSTREVAIMRSFDRPLDIGKVAAVWINGERIEVQ
jgi:hypothetical protein